MTSLNINQILQKFLAVDLIPCIAITDIFKMCTCYFEEKWWRDRRRGQPMGTDKRSTGASSVSYRHNCLVFFVLFFISFNKELHEASFM